MERRLAAAIEWIARRLTPNMILYNQEIDPVSEVAGTAPGGKPIATLAAKALVKACVETRSTALEVSFEGFTLVGRDCGDWRITVERLDAGGLAPLDGERA
jgi:hypothetical protein